MPKGVFTELSQSVGRYFIQGIERVEMRISRVAIVATVLLFAPLSSSASAFADNKTPAPAKQSNSELKAEYKIAFDQFRKDFKVYEDQRREINRIFKEAIDKALADAKSTKQVGQTQIQKRQSMNAKQSAVIAATVARDAAIEALGQPPVAPTQPAKIPTAAKNKSPQTEKSPPPKK
jgi:DNA-directed RNA polymerase